jgi:hypothetical protein
MKEKREKKKDFFLSEILLVLPWWLGALWQIRK